MSQEEDPEWIARRWADRHQHGYFDKEEVFPGMNHFGYFSRADGVHIWKIRNRETWSNCEIEEEIKERKIAIASTYISILYWRAQAARLKANSYRDFKVGCAVLECASALTEFGCPKESRLKFSVKVGMNTKVHEHSRPVCAEPIAVSAAYGSGCSEIIAVMVIGYPREEDTTETLYPCDECRLFLKKHPALRSYTQIITALPPTAEEMRTGLYVHKSEVCSLRDL